MESVNAAAVGQQGRGLRRVCRLDEAGELVVLLLGTRGLGQRR